MHELNRTEQHSIWAKNSKLIHDFKLLLYLGDFKIFWYHIILLQNIAVVVAEQQHKQHHISSFSWMQKNFLWCNMQHTHTRWWCYNWVIWYVSEWKRWWHSDSHPSLIQTRSSRWVLRLVLFRRRPNQEVSAQYFG